MHVDVADLKDFYATPLGQVVRRALARRIRAHWQSPSGGTLVGLGYGAPLLGAFRGEVRHLAALMPAGQGALVWPRVGTKLVSLVEEERLPLRDNSVDRVLVAHGLEVALRPGAYLREIWRVLAAEGSLLMVVPNRRGVWARIDTTPFGQGRPYSRSQLERLLRDALFTPVGWDGALHFPPIDRRIVLRAATAVERIGARISPAFAGVIVVEARKELVAPLGKRVPARALRELVTIRRDP